MSRLHGPPLQLLPQKLIDYILDFAALSYKYPDIITMSAASRVCKAWLPRASYHLFFGISGFLRTIPALEQLVNMTSDARVSTNVCHLKLYIRFTTGASSTPTTSSVSPLLLLSKVLSGLPQLEDVSIHCGHYSTAILVRGMSCPPIPQSSHFADTSAPSANTISTPPKSSVSHLKRVTLTEAPTALVSMVLDIFSSIETLELTYPYTSNSTVSPTFKRHTVCDLQLVTDTIYDSFKPEELVELIDPASLSSLSIDRGSAMFDTNCMNKLIGPRITHFEFACGPRTRGTLTALPALAVCHQLKSAVVTAHMSLADDEHLRDEALQVLASLPVQTRVVTFVHDLFVDPHVIPLLDHVMAGFDWPQCEQALAHCAALARVCLFVRATPARGPQFGIRGGYGLDEREWIILPDVQSRVEEAVRARLSAAFSARVTFEFEHLFFG